MRVGHGVSAAAATKRRYHSSFSRLDLANRKICFMCPATGDFAALATDAGLDFMSGFKKSPSIRPSELRLVSSRETLSCGSAVGRLETSMQIGYFLLQRRFSTRSEGNRLTSHPRR